MDGREEKRDRFFIATAILFFICGLTIIIASYYRKEIVLTWNKIGLENILLALRLWNMSVFILFFKKFISYKKSEEKMYKAFIILLSLLFLLFVNKFILDITIVNKLIKTNLELVVLAGVTFFMLLTTTLIYNLLKEIKYFYKKFVDSIDKPEDRLTIAITVVGSIISLIALLK